MECTDYSKKTTVSVVMCTYNGERYLRQQIDSILAQTYPVNELIIQDDCSSDNTVSIANEYAAKHSCIKVFVNEKRLGYNENFLTAIFKAKEDAIAISDQDDLWNPVKIERQMALFEKGYSLVFHNSMLFNSDLSQTEGVRHKTKPLISGLRLALRPFIPGHECLFTRKVIPLLHAAHEREHKLAYAYLTALACCTLGNIAYIEAPLVSWRRHATAATFTTNSNIGAFTGLIKSITALFNRSKRLIPSRYFAAVGLFCFRDASTRRIVALMQGGVFNLLKACVFCLQHSEELQPRQTPRNKLKALFAPLHLLREGAFLIK